MSFMTIAFRSDRCYEAGMLAHGFFFRGKAMESRGLRRVSIQVWIVGLG